MHRLSRIPTRLFPTKPRPLQFFSTSNAVNTQASIQTRVLDIFKGFEKCKSENLTLSSHFTNDLGLDSLDSVELVLAVEEEFGVEIPDEDADRMITPKMIVDYLEEHAH